MNFDKELFNEVVSKTQETPAENVAEQVQEETEVVASEEETQEEVAEEIVSESEETSTETQETEAPQAKSWLDDDEEAPQDEYAAKLKDEFGIEKVDTKVLYEKLKAESSKEVAKDPLDDDPLVQAVKNLRKANGDIQQFVELIGTQDPSKLTAEQLFETELKKHNLTEDQIADELERFNDKSHFEKIQLTKPIADRLQSERQRKLDEFNAVQKEREQKLIQIRDRAFQEVESFTRGLVNKDFYGLKIDEQKAQRIENAAKQFQIWRPDGSVDAEKVVELVTLSLYKKELVKANIAQASTNGKRAILNELHQPAKTTSVRTAAVHGKETEVELANRLLKKELEAKGVK